jgi:hypothetical protein
MNAATAGLIGAAIGAASGILGNILATWINKHFDERKAQRELMIKTAWDYYSSDLEVAKSDGGALLPPETFIFYTVKIVELAMHKGLSDKKLLNELRKIHEFQKKLITIAKQFTPPL